MAVGSGDTGILHPVPGITMSVVSAGIKKPGRLDCVVFSLGESANVAGVFTSNAFCAAPVTLCKQHLASINSRYFVINTGNANAGTGQAGIENARKVCLEIAELKELPVSTILPFSTGVIDEQLPVEKIVDVLPEALKNLQDDNWLECAKGIMTTDTRPKATSLQVEIAGKTITITGIAKGAGMIKPNMATMLGFIFTDADIEKANLQKMVKRAVNVSFNRITVDSDTSTNDCCMLVASGKSEVQVDENNKEFMEALNSVFVSLAQGLVRDAEGASKFVTIQVEQGASQEECLGLAYTVAESPLVKTALFASDPNWGRILAAVGRAGINDLVIDKVSIFLGDVCIVENGAVSPTYNEADGQRVMDQAEITIRIILGRGEKTETVWTSDLSHDYVTINAEYRT
ncbi:MAG: bifunctional glutamate N-acetyltransferase/amino-acid acetyltransferase ArgJ [Gammaproteobacteria bacterium]|nr:bifunctional glutamate N-acetyltransferase/amino-acid acetyltransferase ArgJ [Gammaproteobacteria bacterium]